MDQLWWELTGRLVELMEQMYLKARFWSPDEGVDLELMMHNFEPCYCLVGGHGV